MVPASSIGSIIVPNNNSYRLLIAQAIILVHEDGNCRLGDIANIGNDVHRERLVKRRQAAFGEDDRKQRLQRICISSD